MPNAAWDRARMQALREEIGDEVIWQQLLAPMAADPQRFYPP
jgi:NTP pyrophosphatase (non-canonical NTP hydrolase)